LRDRGARKATKTICFQIFPVWFLSKNQSFNTISSQKHELSKRKKYFLLRLLAVGSGTRILSFISMQGKVPVKWCYASL